MGETQNQPFQPSFHSSVKVDFQGSRVTSDGGLILVRELDERLGFGDLVAQHLTDSRKGKNTQLPLADLLRQSIYSRIAGYEDVNLGDCSFHGTANLVATANPDFFLITDGLFLFTSADGKSSLTASAEGTLTVNPANPYMADIEYDVTFTGGTGSQAGAHGSGKLHGFVMFTTIDLVQPDDTTVPPEPAAPPAGSSTGKACWLLDGDLDY